MAKTKPAGISEKVIRLLETYTLIAQKQYPSVSSLMERFDISKRSVFRYLEIIGFIDPIEFDHERNGYTFTNGDRIKKLSLSEGELLVLLAAGEAVSHLGQPLAEKFGHLLEKIATTSKASGKKTKSPILVKIPEAVGTDKLNACFTLLSTCATEQRSVDLTYKALHADKPFTRMADPYGLVYHDGVWIMVGYCHLKKAIRSFALDRIVEVKARWQYFTPPTDFDLAAFMAKSFGIFDAEEVTVKVRFGPEACDYIMRKAWHPSEKKEPLPDGGCICTYTVAGTDEIKKWIYSWLPDAEVLEPEWLRKQVQQELTASAANHT